MMVKKGWISLHRQILNHWLWEDKPFSRGQAWIDMLLLANHEDNKTLVGSKVISIKRGSFITSEVKLSDRWGWSRKKTRDFLKILENDGMIVKKSTSKYTTVTIENYSFYQDIGTTKEQQKNIKGTAEEHQRNTNNNNNNDNNINKNIIESKDSMSTSVDEPKIDYEKIMQEFNQKCKSLRPIAKMTKKRKQSIRARIREHGYDSVFAVINNASSSQYLSGVNKYNWVATFDWIIRPNNYVKVLEGNYNDSNSTEKRNLSKGTREYIEHENDGNRIYSNTELAEIEKKMWQMQQQDN